jgi:hypothetical protein
MRHIETPLFSFMSDDDFLFPNFFTDAVEALKQNPEAICFCGGTLHIDFKGEILGHDLESWEDGVYHPPNGLLEMIRIRHPEWQSTLFRREVINDIGIFDIEILAIDYDYLLRVAAQKIIVVSKKPCGAFQKYPPSINLRYNIKQFNQGLLKVISNIRKLDGLSIDVKNEVGETIRRNIHRSVFITGLKSISFSNKDDINGAYEILNNLYPNTKKTIVYNLIYHLKIFGKLLIDLWIILGPIRRYFKRKINKSKYKKYRKLINEKMTISFCDKWGYRINR